MESRRLFYNASVLTPFRTIENAHVLVSGGRIERVGRGGLPELECEKIDLGGATLVPGFIDLHTHGAGGAEFMDGTADAMRTACRTHLAHGTTTLLPTSCTSSDEALFRMFDAWRDVTEHPTGDDGAEMYGFHLEGPYFSMAMKGAQDARYIRDPDIRHAESILERCPRLTRWSAAPETANAMELGRFLRERGVLAAIAHTACDFDTAVEAFENGYTLCTHFYNAMSTIHKDGVFRRCGAVEAAYSVAGYDVEVIADGVHQPLPVLNMVWRMKGASHMCLITDSLATAGIDVPDGTELMLGGSDGKKVLIEDGVAKLADRSAISGSIATTDRLLRNAVKAGIPFADAVTMLTATPARIAGMSKKGVIAPEMDADMVALDEGMNVSRVIKSGRVVK